MVLDNSLCHIYKVLKVKEKIFIKTFPLRTCVFSNFYVFRGKKYFNKTLHQITDVTIIDPGE